MNTEMNIKLAHLPESKQQQLQRASAIIQEIANPDMIILFGSYARGDWVEELGPDEFYFKYQSDFDLLVVTETERQATRTESNNILDGRLRREVKTPVSLIAHDIDFINRRLKKSQYFFLDIKREGICLYTSGRFALAEPKELTAEERRKLAQEDFDYYFKSSEGFFASHEFNLGRDELSIAAFQLHQATERLYSMILLVFTRYKPSTHDLKKLSQRVASIEPEFLKAFPQSTDDERECFDLLRKAYVHARYKPSYRITKDQLLWLADRVSHLQQLAGELCRKKIDSYDHR